jgi:threonine/homoserine/homoserine lactone efflux protein
MEIVIPSVVIVIPGAANIGLFLGAALALLLIPGPAVLYIVARSVEQGRLAAFVSDLGIHTATLVHVLAAVVGLSALLASSALAFAAVKYAGAAYLIWLGLKKSSVARGQPRPRENSSATAIGAFSAMDSSSIFSTRRRRCSSLPFCRNLPR